MRAHAQDTRFCFPTVFPLWAPHLPDFCHLQVVKLPTVLHTHFFKAEVIGSLSVTPGGHGALLCRQGGAVGQRQPRGVGVGLGVPVRKVSDHEVQTVNVLPSFEERCFGSGHWRRCGWLVSEIFWAIK